MAIQIHFINPNIERDTEQMVAELLTVLALRQLHERLANT